MRFKEKITFENRRIEANRIRAKYIDRIPIIIEKNSTQDQDIDKTKYLVPYDFTMGQFVYIIRKRMNLTPDKAIFCFVNNTVPNTSTLIGELYENHKDPDGFLYIVYSNTESVYG
jgi:GABA(A) receptor-associated protein